MNEYNHSLDPTSDELLNILIQESVSSKRNIVVEDKGKEYEYEPIFKRLLDNASEFKIFALGGKEQVINAQKKISNGTYKTSSLGEIYLLDGDFDFIETFAKTKGNIIDDPSVIYLDRYDIENYFIDKEAIESFAQGRARKKMDILEPLVRFTDWHQTITQHLYELFVLFYLVQINDLDIANTKEGKYHFFNDNDGTFNENGYLTYRTKVKENFENLTSSKSFDAEISDCKNSISKTIGHNFSRMISGKHYLWSSQRHLKSKDCYKAEESLFRWWLIEKFNIKQLEWLKERIIQIVTPSAENGSDFLSV